MAFMIPVVKNEWDIYKSNKPRKVSESNSVNSTTNSRSRKISECTSGSLSSSSRPKSILKYQSVPDRISSTSNFRRRTSSECTNSKTKTNPENVELKRSQSWLAKLKKFMKNKSDDERTKS
ncbi:uncharacterized protein LOC143190473 [Rhynchophorus ferrugineus]|uniref:Uncharacterized protein n=1 Tax=Rhynchophorus ferrugineus TaxID=354439 RepID=A0A834MDX6_RHYFE|nr:hypothetical protein GWI33_008762 [Rhynchophorus ferrugineus]